MSNGLILVDIQNDYFPGGRMELAGMTAAGAKAAQLVAYFREHQWPIFFIQHIAVRPGATFFLPQTPGADFHAAVAPLPSDTVIQKHFINSFRETELLPNIHKAGLGGVVICGAMSHMCIDATVRAAFDFGLECVVIHDACATRDVQFEGRTIPAADVHAAFMASLGMAYARVVSLDAFMARP